MNPPDIAQALARFVAAPCSRLVETADSFSHHVDPVRAMVIHPMGARATADHENVWYYFCSVKYCDRFLRFPARYLGSTRLAFGPPMLA